jgi:diguanylate cyclase (GGDEF)-like protein
MISLFNRQGEPLYRNPAARASTRGGDEQLPERFVDAAAAGRILELSPSAPDITFTLAVRTSQGECWHDVSVRSCRDALTGEDAVLVSEVDVSALKRTEAQARFMAQHDALTGLPNRAHLMQRFEALEADWRNAGHKAALIFIDLDHFKNVNDTLGHGAGDELLVQTSRRLSGAIRSTDLVARLGGDEFLVLVASKNIQTEVDHVRARIMAAVSQPLFLGGTEIRITATMGVSVYPTDGSDIETLMRHADLAMYSAKDAGRNDLAYFQPAMGVALHERTVLEADLRRAVERDEFEVHYQPRVCVQRNAIVGAEALVRWRHPERGLVRPDLFIPACENNGLIQVIGMRVFEAAARQQVLWAQRGHDLLVSVNLSPRQFGDPDLLQHMERALRQATCNPQRMEVEITESMLIGSDQRATEILRAIQALGLSIALDDFGTGYSNLAYLRRYPIQTLKIDKTFVHGLETDRPLAELIVSMCRLMRLRIVAEGVETAEQLAWVSSSRIEQYQGFLFSRPLTVPQFDRLLESTPVGGPQPATVLP